MTEQDPIQAPEKGASGAAYASSPRPPYPPYPPAQRPGRPASFWVALVFGLLLFGSFAFNVLFLLLFLFSSAATEGLEGGLVDTQTVERYVDGPESAGQKIAVVDVTGVIGPADMGLLGAPGEDMVTRVRRYLRRASEDDAVVGVVLYVDSPGGAVTDSDQLYQLVREFRTESGKPVAAYFHSVAASGGYYAGMAAEHIVMHPTGITGSIGVILAAWNYHEAAENLGVRRVTVLSEHTPYKDLLAGDRPVREGELEILKSLVEDMYDRFVDVVDQGRPQLTRDRIVELADGRIYSAVQAVANGLVDRAGSLEDAADWVREQSKVEQARLVRYAPRPGLLETLMGVRSPENEFARRLGLLDPAPRLMYLWAGVR